MVRDVLAHEAGHEVVAVVVTRLAAQGQRVACLGAGGLQQLGAQLLGQKIIGIALVDQQGQALLGMGNQGHRVVRGPGAAVIAQVGGERLLPPGHLAGRDDGGEGADAAVAARVAQRQA